jgi:hypothetical protein
MESTKTKIKRQIERSGQGKFYSAEDFIDLANNEQVRLGLSRLVKEDFLFRVAQKIYYFPIVDPILGKVNPSLEEIAQTIANKERIIIKPTGAHALNKLGLSTQVPMKVAFLTNGHSRKIKVGKRTIEFINRSPRKMSYEGPVSGLVLTALEELGSPGLTEEMISRVLDLFKQEEIRLLKADLMLTPKWISEKFIPLLINKLQSNKD